jgi:glycerol-3-phosphate dehydrogenase
MQKLCAVMPWPTSGPSGRDVLPGGDFGPVGIEAYRQGLKSRLPWLPEMQANRYVELYGTRSDALLKGAASLTDLGPLIGADLYAREVDFLKNTEWAQTVEDIIWRRTKLGLRLSPVEIGRLRSYLKDTAHSKSSS